MAKLSQFCEFIKCRPSGEGFIRIIAGKNDKLYDHLMSRWIQFRNAYGIGAMVRFVNSLDAELTDKMDAYAEEWVEENC